MGKKKEPLPVEEVRNVNNIVTLTTAIIQGYTGDQFVKTLPCNTTIVQTFLSFEDNVKPPTQVMWSISHNLTDNITINTIKFFLKDMQEWIYFV